MNCELLCVTFRRDLEYCRYMIRSIQKFERGFEGITIAVPNEDFDAFVNLAREFPALLIKIRSYEDVPGKGFLQHMVKVCEADLLCPNADFIFHIDSDCLFFEPVTPEEYFHEGKPVLLYEPYSTMTHVGRLRWKKAVEDALGGTSENEFMCRHPAVHYRGLYAAARDAMNKHVGDWVKHALAGQDAYPQSFCEYSTLGEVAWRYRRGQYAFQLNDGSHKPKLIQLWSHCPLDVINPPDTLTPRQKMDAILA